MTRKRIRLPRETAVFDVLQARSNQIQGNPPGEDACWTVADRIARAATFGRATPLTAQDMRKVLDLIEACRAATARRPRAGSPLALVAHRLACLDADVRDEVEEDPL